MLLDKLTGIEDRFKEINQELMEVGDDYQRAADLSKERSDLEPLIKKAQAYRQAIGNLAEAEELRDSGDEELAELANIEIAELEEKIPVLERKIKSMLIPKDPRDKRNVILEIRAGAGGDEAGLFGAELYRLYNRYAERKGWKVELLSMHETGVGGIKEVTFMIKGKGSIFQA